MTVKYILAIGLAGCVAAESPVEPVLLFFAAPGLRLKDYKPLLQAQSGYRVLLISSPASHAAWAAAGKKSAADQIEFEKQTIQDWVKAGLSTLTRLKVSSAGTFGHGAGGLAAAAACQMTHVFRACLDLDGETLGSPFLLDTPFDQPFLLS